LNSFSRRDNTTRTHDTMTMSEMKLLMEAIKKDNVEDRSSKLTFKDFILFG